VRVIHAFGTLILINSVSFGQNIAPQKYEVSSVKPNSDGDFHSAFRIERDGTLYATGITLRRLMMTAYQVQGFRLVGGPGWVSDKRWDVQAKPSRAASDKQIGPMLRGLLEDRFQLRVHSETRNMPVYELTVGPHGSKLQRVDDSNIKLDIRTGTGFIRFTKATVATFASQLSYALARPVMDKTGISGEFNFDLEWTPVPGEDGGPTSSGLPAGTPEQPAPTPDGPSIFTAIEEQMGLRLKSGRGPVKVVVIDSAQMPPAN
jgi:bla regulator protein blaR1